MCGVFREGRMPSRKIPPAPRTRRNAPGAKAGCVSLRQGSLHKQRKVARAVTARKLLMLICSRPTKKDQEQLAALAPHPALRATFSRKREKGWQSAFRGREKAVAAGRHAPHGSRKRLAATATITPPHNPPSRGPHSTPPPSQNQNNDHAGKG